MKLLKTDGITGTLFLMQPDKDRSKLKLQNDDFSRQVFLQQVVVV